MYYKIKSIIEMCIIFLIVGLIIWIKYKKIPILCLACEDNGYITKCLPNTGKGSTTCDMYNGIKKAYHSVEEAYSEVMTEVEVIENAFLKPIQDIENSITKLKEVFGKIKIPQMPSIPPIPTIEIDVNIDFSKIPSLDLGDMIINPIVNSLIDPMKIFIQKLQNFLDSITSGLNSAIKPIEETVKKFNEAVQKIIETGNDVIDKINKGIHLNMPGIPSANIPPIHLAPIKMPTIPKIGHIDFECKIDLRNLIESAVKELLTIGKTITDSINDHIIKSINNMLTELKNALDNVVSVINEALHVVVETIQTQITQTIEFLQHQLENLNIFNKILPKIQKIIYKIKKIDASSLLKSFLSYIQDLLPWANIGTTLIIIIMCVLSPYIFNFLNITFQILGLTEMAIDKLYTIIKLGLGMLFNIIDDMTN